MEIRIEAFQQAYWAEVAAIYSEAIAGGIATFETECPSWEEWDAAHLVSCRLVARSGSQIVGWAALSPVSRRPCYAGVAEASVYVAGVARGGGVGRRLLDCLIEASEAQGIWTLQGVTLAENVASLRLQEECGFRVVGRRERIGELNGIWRDTILTERRSSAVLGGRTEQRDEAGETRGGAPNGGSRCRHVRARPANRAPLRSLSRGWAAHRKRG